MMLVDGGVATGIPVDDRGFAYGDGVFETLLWDGRRAPLLTRHLARLTHGARQLGFAAPDTSVWHEDIAALGLPAEPAVIRVVLTRGSGPRGYRPPLAPSPRRVVSWHPRPAHVVRWHAEGTAVRICDLRVGSNPRLAGVKHLNRLEQVLARAEWQDEAIGEGLMLDGNDAVVGGTMSNVCVLRDGVASTPPVVSSGIAGVVRQILLERGLVVERPLTRQDLREVHEAVLCNAVIGAVRVTALDGRALAPGAWTQAVRSVLAAEGLAC